MCVWEMFSEQRYNLHWIYRVVAVMLEALRIQSNKVVILWENRIHAYTHRHIHSIVCTHTNRQRLSVQERQKRERIVENECGAWKLAEHTKCTTFIDSERTIHRQNSSNNQTVPNIFQFVQSNQHIAANITAMYERMYVGAKNSERFEGRAKLRNRFSHSH